MKWKAHLSGIGFATIFGCSFLASKVTLEFLSPLGLLSFRFLLAFIAFEILRLTKVIHIRFTKQVIRLVWWVVLFQPLLYFLFETYGLHFSSSSEAGMMIALIPIVVAILSSIILKEKPTLLQWGCILLSIGGILLIETMGVGGSRSNNWMGVLLLLGAVIAAAFFNIFSRKASQELHPMEITYFMMLGGAIVFNGMNVADHLIHNSFATYLDGLSNPIVLIALLYLGIASSVVAFFLVNYSLSKLTAPISSLYSNLSTVITILMGVLFLQETLTVYHIIGSIMIIVGVYLSTVLKRFKVL
ncbi:MAG: DMT family transporter [Bacilli bacterium]|nr:DMT family transporter [Bacilli bacterium]